MRAGEFMSQPPITIGDHSSAADAAERMIEHQIDCLPVVDDQGDLRGMVTPSDYTTREKGIPFSIFRAPQLFGQWLPPGGIAEIYRAARETPIRNLMTTSLITCEETATLEEVVRLLVERRVHHVIVTRGKKPVGVIARHDLLRVLERMSQPRSSS